MTMLTKLFGPKKIKPSAQTKLSNVTEELPPDDRQTALRIIHAGGAVECYYMAIPAVKIMEKYPRLVLARPEVFHKPWESLVRPEEILTPGEKFYLVPRGTVRKLQKRVKRASVRLKAVRRIERKSESECESLFSKETEKKVRFFGVPSRDSVTPTKKKVRFAETWEPSLLSIDESSPLVEVKQLKDYVESDTWNL